MTFRPCRTILLAAAIAMTAGAAARADAPIPVKVMIVSMFGPEGGVWRIEFNGTNVHVPDPKRPWHLRELVSRPRGKSG